MIIAAPAEKIYDMIADMVRMGEWSPACTGATWDDGAGPTAGSWFTGHNRAGERVYDTRCEITDAQRPHTIAWMAGGRENGRTEWRYSFVSVATGTEVTETWTSVRNLPLEGEATEVRERLEQIRANFSAGIEQTLANLKSAAERGV